MAQPSQIGSNSFRRRRSYQRQSPPGPANPLSQETLNRYQTGDRARDMGGPATVAQAASIAGLEGLRGRLSQNINQLNDAAADVRQEQQNRQQVFSQDWQDYARNAPNMNRRDGFVNAPADRGPVSPLSPEYMAQIQNEQANADFRLAPGGSQMLDRFSRLGRAAEAQAAREAYGPLTGQALVSSQARSAYERAARQAALVAQGIAGPLTGTRRLRTYAEANAERLAGRNSPNLVAAREQRAEEQRADRRMRAARRYGLNPLTPQGFAASDPEGYAIQQGALGVGRTARESGEIPGNPLRGSVPSGPPRSAAEAQQRAGAMVELATKSPALQTLGVMRTKPDGTSEFATIPEIAENVLSTIGSDEPVFSDNDLQEVQRFVKEMKHQSRGENIFGDGYAASLLSDLTDVEDTPEARTEWVGRVRQKNKAGLFGRIQGLIYGNSRRPNTQGDQISRPSQIWPMPYSMGAE